MKTLWEEMLLALFMGVIIPGFLLSAMVWMGEEREIPEASVTTRPSESPSVSIPVKLRDPEGMAREGELESYLVGVVLAEMPAYFEQEALKAQAVVARTYTMRAAVTGGKHGDGSICTQASCCQAYIPEEEYLEKGGTEMDLEKVRTAVEETAGQVLTYEGELIEATYFSCSGGVTEDAQAVWGTDFPYLRSVESPGEEGAAYYNDTVRFTSEAFQSALGIQLEGNPGNWFGDVVYTAGDGVDTMVIGDQVYKGTQLRSLLGLRSTAFTVTVAENEIRIHTRGYGHRVGMSQYGADAMAVSGSTYTQILNHYYQGTRLTELDAVRKEAQLSLDK